MADIRTLTGLILAAPLVSCAPEIEDRDRSEDAPLTSSVTTVAPAVIRIAPDHCAIDSLSGQLTPWMEPDTIPLAGGRLLELQGCNIEGDAYLRLRYDGPLPGTRFHVVEGSYYEGAAWFVVNGGTGQLWAMSGEPVVSPDFRWFATAGVDLEAGYTRSHLDIWAIEADSVRRVLAMDGGDVWGASDPQWILPGALEYLRIGWRLEPAQDRWLDSTHARVVLRDSVWATDSIPGN